MLKTNIAIDTKRNIKIPKLKVPNKQLFFLQAPINPMIAHITSKIPNAIPRAKAPLYMSYFEVSVTSLSFEKRIAENTIQKIPSSNIIKVVISTNLYKNLKLIFIFVYK